MDQDKRKEIINSSETQEDLGVREDGVQVTGVQESGIQSESAVPHKRRVRYKGTHPRKFEEKYKEHQPEKYRDTIEKVISKGSTPAGMHISIMVNEILDFLQIQPGQTGLDATLGYGGHTGICWSS